MEANSIFKAHLNSKILFEAIQWDGKNIFDIIHFIDKSKTVKNIHLDVIHNKLDIYIVSNNVIELYLYDVLVKNEGIHTVIQKFSKEGFARIYNTVME